VPYKNREEQLAAQRRHYIENKEKYLQAGQRTRIRNKQIVHDAKSKPCADCGIQYPYYVMQFDHVRGEKEFNVGHAVYMGKGKSKILAEIAK
jgi:hypothetical protein